MFKTLTSAAGLVLLVSSFAAAGQTPVQPTEPPKVTIPSPQKHHSSATNHHKHHKKHHAPTTQPAPKQ